MNSAQFKEIQKELISLRQIIESQSDSINELKEENISLKHAAEISKKQLDCAMNEIRCIKSECNIIQESIEFINQELISIKNEKAHIQYIQIFKIFKNYIMRQMKPDLTEELIASFVLSKHGEQTIQDRSISYVINYLGITNEDFITVNEMLKKYFVQHKITTMNNFTDDDVLLIIGTIENIDDMPVPITNLLNAIVAWMKKELGTDCE